MSVRLDVATTAVGLHDAPLVLLAGVEIAVCSAGMVKYMMDHGTLNDANCTVPGDVTRCTFTCDVHIINV